MRSRRRHATEAAVLAAVLALWSPAACEALAQDSEPRARTIEEIVVTAQRAEQELHDVPISMSALDAGFLRERGVTDLQDVARYVPNFRVDIAGPVIQPRIRGFSTNTTVNRGLELPVGIVIDDVPYSRADYFAGGLFDLERVEVLRGPQGVFFGANSAVGLVNLTTRNPTDALTGYVDATLGELDARRFEGGVGGPLLPGIANIRIAALSDEQDGYVENTTARVVPNADDVLAGWVRRSVRAKLDFPDLLGGSLLVSYQRDDLELGPTPRELTFVPQKFHSLLRQYDPNVDLTDVDLVASLDASSFRRVDLDTFAAKMRYDIGHWDLAVVAGWSGLDSREQDDQEGAPWDLNRTTEDEVSRQTTFELRVTSPALDGFFGVRELLGRRLGSTELTSGFFFQRRVQDPTVITGNLDENLLLLVQALNRLPDGPVEVARPPSKVETLTTRFEQTADEFSGYGQMSWSFIERWTFISGMRLDYTTKEASWNQYLTPQAVLLRVIADEFTDERSSEEFNYAPKVGVTFDWTDDLNLYATWSKGFQAGGFNTFSTVADPANRIIKPARVQSWEAGTKSRLFDGRAELNVGLFWMTMEDFQLFTLSPTPTSNFPVPRVVNVGELRARGVEADSTWLPTQWLTVRGALGFNDAEYLSFPLGTCFSDKQGPGGFCDLAGRPLEQAPHWDVSLTPSVRVPLATIPGLGAMLHSGLAGIDLVQVLSVQYTDNRYLNDSDDPRTRQPSYFYLSGSVGFANAGQGWSVQFRVENMTDARTANTAVEGTPASGIAWKASSPPRLMYGGIRWEF